MHITKAWRMQDWKSDIAAFERWRELYVKYGSDFALKRMQDIREQWPEHCKQMQIPELSK